MSDSLHLDSSKTVVYPFCYKIKESCPPVERIKKISVNRTTDCLHP